MSGCRSMCLVGGRVLGRAGFERADVRIERGRVSSIALDAERRGDVRVPVEGALVLPGLVNAHDHLDLGHLPRLGTPPYPDLRAWGESLHDTWPRLLRSTRRISTAVAAAAALERNARAGVTHVLHHGARAASFHLVAPALCTVEHAAWAHSLDFDAEGLRRAMRGVGEVFVHAAEGDSDRARRELDVYCDRKEEERRRLVLIHACAAGTREEATRLVEAGLRVIACPASTRFLYGATADLPALANAGLLGLGSDAPVSGGTTFLEDLRLAHALGLSAEVLLDVVLDFNARLVGLRSRRDGLRVGMKAHVAVVDAWPPHEASARLTLLGGRPTWSRTSLGRTRASAFWSELGHVARQRTAAEAQRQGALASD